MANFETSGLAILERRLKGGYHPSLDDDGYKVMLSIDAGGMAGVVSLAACKPLAEQGLLEVIDGFSGTSAGGLNAAYAATGQINEGIDVYINRLPDEGFINPNLKDSIESWRVDRRLRLQRLEVLERIMSEGESRLHTKRLQSSNVPVIASITHVPKFTAESLDLRDLDDKQIIDFLLAGAAMPFISGKSRYIDGIAVACLDGSLALKATEQLALAEGPSHIVSLANSPYVPNKYSHCLRLWHSIYGHMLARNLLTGETSFARNYQKLTREQAQFLATFKNGNFLIGDVRVDKIHPSSDRPLPKRFTTDKTVLKAGAEAGAMAMRKALDLVNTKSLLP